MYLVTSRLKTSRGLRRAWRSRLLFALLVSAVVAAFTVGASARRQEPQQATALPTPVQLAPGVVRLPLATGDIAYDSSTQKVYASIPSRAGDYGNSLTALDPATAQAAEPVPVGSEPFRLAISRAGRHLYVALDGAGKVRRFDTVTQTAGAEFAVGTDSFGNTLSARDLDVSPDNPDVVAVTRYRKGFFSGGDGVAVYENGNKRPNEITGSVFITLVRFGAAGSVAYGYDNGSTENFTYKLAVDADGVKVTKKTGLINAAADVRFESGRLYGSNGQVADPEAFKILGSYAAVGPTFADAAANRTYVLARDNNTGAVTLYAFDLTTFVPLGYLDVPGVSGNATRLVPAGAGSVAFRTTADQVYFLSLSALKAYTPPEAGPVPRNDGVRQVRLSANDFVYNPSDGLFYVSVPSSAGGARGNSITTVNPSTGEVGPSFFVGSEPDALALSDDGRQLYVSLYGAAAVRRYDTLTKTPGLSFDLGRSNDPTIQSLGPRYARSLAVVPGNPNAVAVARYYPSIGSTDGVYVYDDGVIRPKGASGTHIAFTETGSLLGYYGDSTDFGLRKYALTSDGFNETATALGVMSGFGTRFDYAGGRVYGQEGSVVDVTGAPTRLGRFNTPYARLVATAAADSVVYYVSTIAQAANNTLAIEAYDKQTFIQTGAGQLKGVPNTVNVAKFVRYGADGLAVLMENGQLFFFSTSAVQPLAPTPQPTPVQVAEGVLRVPLSVNDLMYDRVSGKLYASIPSRAPSDRPTIENVPGTPYSFGNSVATVDPLTGALGTPVFMGSEPGRLAATRDGQFLYAALNETGEVRRLQLPTRTPGLKFVLDLPTDPNYGARSGQSRVTDMEAVPGLNGSVAVARGERAVIYDEGAPRTVTNDVFSGRTNVIEFSSVPDLLYGMDSDTSAFKVYRMPVDYAGVRINAQSDSGVFNTFGADMKFDSGRIYTSTGKVIDPQTLKVTAQFASVGEVWESGLVLPDPAAGRVYFLKGSGIGQTFTLLAFDQTTMQQVGSMTIPNPGGAYAASFVRWGADGFAFRTYQPGTGGAEPLNLYLVRNASLVPARAVGPSSLQFDAAAKSVTEGTWEVFVKVTRTGDTTEAASVRFETADGTAKEVSDYTAALGTLRFEPGETEKSFPVMIAVDAYAEPDETFTVALKDASGATLGANSVLTLTVKDGTTPNGPSPVRWDAFNPSFFVRQHYNDFLNRNPDPEGLNFWTGEINSCGANTQCAEVKRVNVSAAFFLSIEFQETGYLAYRTYKAAYGDIQGKPVPVTLREFLADTREMGEGVVVGRSNWSARLEENKRTYFDRFVATARFTARYPSEMTPAAFVNALDQNAGGVLTQGERDALASELTAAGNTSYARAITLRKVAENPELARRELNRAFVLMQYFGYLRRDPDAAPDTDFGGYNFWLSKLNDFNGNFVNAEMVKAFITSIEYTRRFGQP